VKLTNPFVLLIAVGGMAVALAAIWANKKDDMPVNAPHTAPSPEARPQLSKQPTVLPRSSTVHIRAGDVSWTWPLVANEATIRCSGLANGPHALIVEIGDSAYAINGTASAAGYAPLDAQWLDDERNPGTKVSISDLIAFATSLCVYNTSSLIAQAPAKIAAQAAVARARQHVTSRLKDPASAQFQDVTYDASSRVACGQVNAKNSFGGYTGFRQFWVQMPADEEAVVWIDSGKDRLAQELCGRP
jgi:hypothetical protein